MRRYVNPRAGRLPALEQNILKYRAMQMVLILFYAEEIRNLIIDSVSSNQRFARVVEDKKLSVEASSTGAKRDFEKALRVLSEEGIVTEAEKKEIVQLIDYRNHIAHRIYGLTADIGHSRIARDYVRFSGKGAPKYDYAILDRLESYRKKISQRMASRFTIVLSFSSPLFEPAERTFKKELKRLHRRIERQITTRKHENAKLSAELSLEGTEFVGDFQPYHPLNQYRGGRLTKRGVEICYRLYDFGKQPLTVAHLMQISLKAAVNRKRLWKAAGGRNRRKMDIATLSRNPARLYGFKG